MPLLAFFKTLLNSHEFMPHGHCYFWNRGLITLHVASDVLIGISYVVIALLLWRLVRRIQVPFSPLILAFGVFILACGLTHFMEVWTLWTPNYWLAGAIKALTAGASISTAIAVLPLRTRVLRMVQAAASSDADRAALEAKTHELARLNEAAAKDANIRLQQSEESFQALVDNLPQMAWSAKPEGDIDFYNRGWYRYTGTTFAQMKGWGWESVHSPEFLPEVRAKWKRSLERGELFEMEFPLKAEDGTYRWFLTRVQPLKNARGEVLRWFGTNTDVDEKRKEAAALQTAVEARDTFLSVASHELKTPLTALALTLDALSRANAIGPTDSLYVERVRRSSTLARRQLHKLSELVNDLLDVSRISSGQFRMELTEVDLVAIVRECVSRFTAEPEYEASGAKIQLEVRAPERLIIRTARLRLEQVITNLLDNAIKYGAGKPIEVRVEGDGLRSVVAVCDHGIGIDPLYASQIFERFGRAVSHRHYGGLGLGLYISRTIVEGLSGAIRVQSAPGFGATFTVELPAISDAATSRLDGEPTT